LNIFIQAIISLQ